MSQRIANRISHWLAEPSGSELRASDVRASHRPVIFYGVAGEGLGHASRATSVIEQLPDCDVHLFTFGKAYEYFAKQNLPRLHPINGLMFSYRRGRVHYPGTLWQAAKYWCGGMGSNIEQIGRLADVHQPDLFLTDFEPSIARAAHWLGRPVISIDNQHKFVFCEAGSLPRFLRMYAALTGFSVKRMIPRPTHSVIATFHADKLKKLRANVTLTGGILRNAVEEIVPTNEGFVLAYIRESVGEKILRSLTGCGREVRVYGASQELRKQFPAGFDFRELSPEFVRDLAACDRVISTAGNQLISECRYFGKPILAIPEPGQYEQSVNTHYVEEIGLGRGCEISQLSAGTVREFLEHFGCRAERIPNGVHATVEVVRRFLSESQHARRENPVSVRRPPGESARADVGLAGVSVAD